MDDGLAMAISEVGVIETPDTTVTSNDVKKEEKSAGIYEVDFSVPLKKSGMDVVLHRGEAFYYEPTKTKLYSLKELGFKTTEVVLDLKKINKIYKEIEKRGEKVLPDNLQLFLEETEPDVPTEWFNYYIILLGTIRVSPNGSLMVLQMYGNDFTKARVFKYRKVDDPFGAFARIACY